MIRGGHLGRGTGDTECTSQRVGVNRRRVCRFAGSLLFIHALGGTLCTPVSPRWPPLDTVVNVRMCKRFIADFAQSQH
jgi:hypothetical protein